MPTISGRTISLAQGAVIENVLLGSQYELAPADGTIEIGLLADSTAGAVTFTCTIFSGPDVLQEPGGLVPQATLATKATPAYPDDYHWEDEVARGDRLKIRIQNSSATALAGTVAWILRFTPA